MFGQARRRHTADTPHTGHARRRDRFVGWKSFIVAAPAAALIFATACGAQATTAPSPAATALTSASPTTAPPTAPPTPAARQAGGAGGADAQEVTVVTRANARFTPSTLTVEAGRPVRLVLRNEGAVVHDLTLRLGTAGLAEQVSVVAAGGSTASATFTPAAPGTYVFVCSQPGHEAAGMTGTLNVVAAGS